MERVEEEEEDEEAAEEDGFDLLINLIEAQEPKPDQFAFLLELCKIPDFQEQEQELRNCLFASESENPSRSSLRPYPHPRHKTTPPPPPPPPVTDKFLTPPEQLPDSIPDESKAIDSDNIIELISDEEVEKVETLQPNCCDGTEQKGKRKLPWSMTGKGSWDKIDKDNRRDRGKMGVLDEEVEEVETLQSNCSDGTEQKRKTKLPLSMTGKGSWDKMYKDDRGKMGFLDYVTKAAKLLKEEEKVDDDVDILETAKKRGLEFPRPRWWPPGGFK